MADEGYDVPPLPCALIEAKNKKEAAEKILIISSQYGKMTNHSLEDFLAENDLDLPAAGKVIVNKLKLAGRYAGLWRTAELVIYLA